MRKRFIHRFLHNLTILLLFFVSASALAQEQQSGSAVAAGGDADKGKALFNSNCAACHKLNSKLVGPALSGVTTRRSMEFLHKWIPDNAALRASGDATANALFDEYNHTVMPAFPNLSEKDINNILAYTEVGGKGNVKTNTAGGGNGEIAANTPEKKDNTVELLIIGAVLLLLIILLVRVKNTLKQVKGESTTSIIEDANVITRTALKNPKLVTFITILIAIVFFQQLFVALMDTGVHQGYQPKQPIAFSHKLHAGDNKIDCKYCHYGARKSMESNIPSPNVCMNCHRYIQEGPTTGTKEIQKIYDAVGFDPKTGQYIEGYDQKPIKWKRIHDLPDLAYFNHSQHVTVGKIACQTCHGPIQEMKEVYQYSPLTMGWCINCHRETKVQIDNGYYTDIHKKLQEKYGKDAVITEEMVGGLECGKCHY